MIDLSRERWETPGEKNNKRKKRRAGKVQMPRLARGGQSCASFQPKRLVKDDLMPFLAKPGLY